MLFVVTWHLGFSNIPTVVIYHPCVFSIKKSLENCSDKLLFMVSRL